MPYEYEGKYSPGDSLDAVQAAEVVSENSEKKIDHNNISSILSRRGVRPTRVVGRSYLYPYDQVRRVAVRQNAGQPRVGADPLTAAERMRRKRAGLARKNNRRGGSGSSAGPGADAPGAAAADDPGGLVSSVL